MGYPTKIQLIKRISSEQWYVNFPAAVAQAIEFQQGEIVEWLIDDHQNLILKRSDEAVAPLKKTQDQKKNVMDEFNKLWALSRTAFKQQRTFDRVRQLAYGAITCLGRHTISGVITACGRQFLDWSSAYRVKSCKE